MNYKSAPAPKFYQKWEYKQFYIRGGSVSLKDLNELGVEGWELCGIEQTVDGPSDLSSNWAAATRFFFKRPIKTK